LIKIAALRPSGIGRNLIYSKSGVPLESSMTPIIEPLGLKNQECMEDAAFVTKY
jgi:hypothetical protein